jgi:hypothetical protein
MDVTRKALHAVAFALGVTTLVAFTPGAAYAHGSDVPGHQATGTCFVLPDGARQANTHPVFLDLYPEANTLTWGSGQSVEYGNQWVYFRAWVSWRDASGVSRYRAGNWWAALGGWPSTNGTTWVQQPNGTWTQVFASYGWVGDVALERSGLMGGYSVVSLPGAGNYWVGAEYYWPPLGDLSGKSHFEWFDKVTC